MQAHITGLPQEVLATPLGQMLAPMLSPLEQQLGNIHQQPAGESGPASQTAQGNTVAAAGASRPSPATSSQQVCESFLPVQILPACVFADWQQVQSTCCIALVRYNVHWAFTFSPIIWDSNCHAFGTKCCRLFCFLQHWGMRDAHLLSRHPQFMLFQSCQKQSFVLLDQGALL